MIPPIFKAFTAAPPVKALPPPTNAPAIAPFQKPSFQKSPPAFSAATPALTPVVQAPQSAATPIMAHTTSPEGSV